MPQTAQREADSETLLTLISEFLAETRQQSGASLQVELDSQFERDLGLDSLAKTELLLRVERAYGLRLPEAVVAAETPRELLAAVPAASRPAQKSLGVAPVSAASHKQRAAVPAATQTLVEMLDWHAQAHPEQTAVYLYEDSEQAQPISYAELVKDAETVAAGLQERGVQAGQTVAIMLPTGRGYFASFFGILWAGAVPVPIYPPLRPSQLEEHLRRHARILANAQVQLLITVAEAKKVALLLRAQVSSLRHIATVPELQGAGRRPATPVRAQDLAFLQYTSGSTGDPKGVMLTHANLLANIQAMAQRLRVNTADVFVSWLPLYHDMGLIGACLGSLHQGIPLAVMSPLRFLRRPASWLWAIHQHRGTLSAAPNFAYELCLRNIHDEDIQGLDLSSWRLAVNGAEPVSPATMRRFAERFAPFGFKSKALAPVYGLAESSVGLALPTPGRGLVVDRIQRSALSQRGLAIQADPEDPDTLEIPACGHALSGHEIRIVDNHGHELSERGEGHIQFRGPSATQGYLNNPQASADLFTGPWLKSGDCGYLAGGDVYITGRVKDMIIRGGRNIYPYELEQAVGELDGVRKGCVAVFAVQDPEQATERIVIVAETRLSDPVQLTELRTRIRECSETVLGQAAEIIECVPPHTVLKTSSGKIRRAAMRELYKTGRLQQRGLPVWLQVLRLGLSSIVPASRKILTRIGTGLYGAYAWLVLGLFSLPAALAVSVLPSLKARWRAVHAIAYGAAKLAGLKLTRAGLEQLPQRPFVAACNHASYLDAIVLVAALPERVCFVAKQELANNPVLRCLLRRLGVLFVERFDARQGAQASEQIIQALARGVSMLFFPEGTFTRAPGLLPFRSGAFVAAAHAGAPIVPLILQGSRDILRADTWWPRRGRLHLQIEAPINPSGHEWSDIVRLREQTRRVILNHYQEPDLDWTDSPFARRE